MISAFWIEFGLVSSTRSAAARSRVACVRYLGRRAGDYQASARHRQLRGAAESIRGQVMSRGWHQRPVIGPVLMWINRHVPW
jgi:hypothetical protein